MGDSKTRKLLVGDVGGIAFEIYQEVPGDDDDGAARPIWCSVRPSADEDADLIPIAKDDLRLVLDIARAVSSEDIANSLHQDGEGLTHAVAGVSNVADQLLDLMMKDKE